MWHGYYTIGDQDPVADHKMFDFSSVWIEGGKLIHVRITYFWEVGCTDYIYGTPEQLHQELTRLGIKPE